MDILEHIIIPPGAYELESLDKEIKRIIIEQRLCYRSKLSVFNQTKFFNIR